MAQACCALPILPGKRRAAPAFLIELEGVRNEHSAASERRLGLIKEVWAVQQAPEGDLVVVSITGEAIGNAFQQFATAHDALDQWLQQLVRDTTGVALHVPPPGPPREILSDDTD